ncbi:MAG: hypothetical protein ACREV6_10130 [Clostridium sp.]|uniref:hypothetical protein n=1 Tax=Clostridium sp. TaxID=1506 RepID=UPI003D6D58CD
MSREKAWFVFHNEVVPQIRILDEKGMLKFESTTYSDKDWDNGVCVVTNKGEIHILEDGKVVDDGNLLKL